MQVRNAHGKVCYIEMPAVDVALSAEFYKTVFGWEIRKRSNGATAFDDGVEVSGAFVTGRPPSREAGLLVYIMVRDAAVIVSAIEAAGGAIVEPIHPDAPEIIARFRDPAGNVLGIYQERALASPPTE